MNRSIVIGVSAVMLAACSNGSASEPTGPTTAATSATSVVPPSSTIVTTTSSPASSTAMTSTTITAPPASTTTVPSTEDQVKQAVQDYADAYHQCGVAPGACDAAQFTASRGPSRAIVSGLAASMAEQGIYFLADARGSYVIDESVNLDSDDEATAIFCVYDAGTVLGPEGPDGLPTVINDQVLSFRNQYHLYRENGRWLVGEKTELERLGEGDLCPPAA